MLGFKLVSETEISWEHNQEQHTGGESSQPTGADEHPQKQKGRRPGWLGAVPFQQAQDKAGRCAGLSEGSDYSFWAQVNSIPTNPAAATQIPPNTSTRLVFADWTCPVWLGEQRWSLWLFPDCYATLALSTTDSKGCLLLKELSTG